MPNPKVIVANYTDVLAGALDPPQLAKLQKLIGADANMTVDMYQGVIDRCDGWVDTRNIPPGWSNCYGLVLVDAAWNWRACQPRPNHSPFQRFSSNPYTLARFPVAMVTVANKATWMEDAARAMAATLKSANPAPLVGPRPGVRPLLGRLLLPLVVVHRLVVFVLRLLHIIPTPQDWGP